MENGPNLNAFKTIVSFVNELKDSFGGKQKSLQLYARLLEKTTVMHEEAIKKHNNVFKSFCTENKDCLVKKDPKLLVNNLMKYSEKVYIDMKDIFQRSDSNEKQVIWKYLLKIYALVDPTSEAKKILKETINKGENANEETYLNGFIDKINDSVENGGDPMACMTMIPELLGSMNNGIQSGELDMGKLLGTVQGMMGTLSKLAAEASEGDESGPDGMPDLGAMMGQMSGMLGAVPGGMPGGMAGGMPGGMHRETRPRIEEVREEDTKSSRKSKEKSKSKESRKSGSRDSGDGSRLSKLKSSKKPEKRETYISSDEEEDALIKTKN